MNVLPYSAAYKPVVCSDCGATVPGLRTRRGRWAIRKHRRPDGRRCRGDFHVSGHRLAAP